VIDKAVSGKQRFARSLLLCYNYAHQPTLILKRGDLLEPLTAKQKRVLMFIEEEVARCNYPPSVREIGKALGINSTATVHAYLDTLQRKGYIDRMPTKPRAIKIIRSTEGNREMKCAFAPLVGKITAGTPVLAEENRDGYFPIPENLHTGEGCFVLKVSGSSMSGAGIFDGDYVIVRQQNIVDNGDIAAALIEDEATIKRFFHDDDQVRLQPENDAYETIFVREVQILGKVVGLFRKV
jgi:repressor LexA